MLENETRREVLAIRQADHFRPASLSLAGTVLICHEKWWAGDVTWYLPLEWMTVTYGRRRNQRSLVNGALTFLGLLLGSFVLVRVSSLLEVLKPVPLILLLLAFLSLAITPLFWLRRRPTVILTAEPAKTRWEFFEDRDPHGPQRRFLEELRVHQGRIRDIEPFPAKSSFARSKGRRWRELAQLIFLFSIPGIITEQERLLLLALLPVGWELVRNARLLLQPKSFRNAERSARRGRYQEAIEALRPVLTADPAHKPSLQLFFECCMELGWHEEALEAISGMKDLDPERAHEMEEDRWLFRRIHERMKKRL